MYHVFKDDSLTDLQFVVKAPQPHIIAAQAGVAAQPVDVRTAVTHFGTPDGRLVETVELTGRPFFVGVQYHPEFKSRPNKAHPLFRGFIAAALDRAEHKR